MLFKEEAESESAAEQDARNLAETLRAFPGHWSESAWNDWMFRRDQVLADHDARTGEQKMARLKFTVEVAPEESSNDRTEPVWDVCINNYKIGTVIRSPDKTGNEKYLYRDWIIDSPSHAGRFTTLDAAAWHLIQGVVNFERGTIQQRTIVDLNLAEERTGPEGAG